MILASNFSMSVEHDNAEQYIGFARISSLHLLMKIAQCLLTTFLSCHISESSCKEIYAQLDNGIKTAVKDTLEAVRSTEHSSEILDAVIKVFRCDNEHIVADDYDEYREDDNHKIFFKYKREYFFKAEGLAAYLNRKTGKRYSGKAILSELDELLTFTSEGVSRHLPRKLRKIKPKNNKRFSALSEDVLIDRIVSKSSSYFDYCSSPINKLRQNNF